MALSNKELVPLDTRTAEGGALRRLIECSPYNQKKVAALADIDPSYLSAMLQGGRPINQKAACSLAKTLNVDVDDISHRLAHEIRQASLLVKQMDGSGLQPADCPYEPLPAWPKRELVERVNVMRCTLGQQRAIEVVKCLNELIELEVAQREREAQQSPAPSFDACACKASLMK